MLSNEELDAEIQLSGYPADLASCVLQLPLRDELVQMILNKQLIPVTIVTNVEFIDMVPFSRENVGTTQVTTIYDSKVKVNVRELALTRIEKFTIEHGKMTFVGVDSHSDFYRHRYVITQNNDLTASWKRDYGDS